MQLEITPSEKLSQKTNGIFKNRQKLFTPACLQTQARE